MKISDNLYIDFERAIIIKEKKSIPLSRLELRLLRRLAKTPNETVSSQELINYTWVESGENVTKIDLSICIRRLRLKFEENPREPMYILTVRGSGYFLFQKK